MKETLKKCEACEDIFRWDDEIVIVEDELFHTNCVSLHSIGFFATLDGEPLGEVENEDGQDAYEFLDEGEYLEEDDYDV